ncbi:Bacteriophage P22, Gp10, DNA-stabilising [uncultured Caudovirales phage]|uniref:Bacteriophage P22, Gp10, DNA-stabilising n=1 Tax=uncultured Caudovirales phage TaxID=2100421 RepID=A0A6J5PQA7_9CAUD|nr:Bacteriophage P22, Gp10, DNA-stabilising [uncultured Caudovirales phage]CAB4171531.1 Bacteriophage P22, Gp10, DNA-stabilising [uncultured Caudovirales phage]CAB4177784.1 Bacteriophage P22, Gp10, DNA-stabilising [uncultured Caudovirales phage]CAB4201950.1 Bacteriophage P22, Gp10, DNA-stabilising [uncultured Caudovirales phage]
MKTPILGQSYVARSVNAADSRMVNLFPETIPGEGQTSGFLNRAPGLRLLLTVGTGPIRGLWSYGGYAYAVSGTQVYKITTAWTATLIGSVSGTGQVSIADNGRQMFIACNGPSYIYDNQTNAFAQITDIDFPGAVTVNYIDGYFQFNEPNSQRIWVSEILDGTQIDPLSFASAEGSPDGVVSTMVDHREVWIFGTNSVEVWYDSGATDFPLTRIQGAFNEIGCAATFSVAKLDNALFWLGADARGRGIVYRANGYSGVRVSTHAVEWQIQNYGNISDAIAYTYQRDGHSFYVLIFPSAGATWVYDVATQAWHERAGWSDGEFVRHRSNCQVEFNSQNVVGDYQNGNIYAFDLDVYADNGAIQKWLRSWRALPPNQNNLKRMAQHSLQLDAETGVGLNDGQGSDPQVMLRWSDDGGHTWSSEHWASMGKIGAFFYRTFWRRLGMTTKLRDRVYEVSGTDPIKIAIVGAELNVSGTNA